MRTRVCSKHAGDPLPLTAEFFKPDSRYAEGFKRWCRNCERAYVKAWRAGDSERQKGYWQKSNEKRSIVTRRARDAKAVERGKRFDLMPLECAYLAGLVDGKGTITCQQQGNGHGLSYRIIIANSNRELIDWLATQFGGGVYRTTTRSARHRQVWTWIIGSEDSAELARRLLPYLRIKRRQAEIILELVSVSVPWGLRNKGVPPEWIPIRHRLDAEMKELNRRGLPVEEPLTEEEEVDRFLDRPTVLEAVNHLTH